MVISQNGLNVIKNFEGLVLRPYLDQVGVPTIGYGTTHYPGGLPVTMKDSPISEVFAEKCLENDLETAEYAVGKYVTSSINQNQFDSLVDFSYNCGTGALHGSTLLRRVNANPGDPAIRDAFMMWTKGHIDGQLVIIPDLQTRRKQEADLYFSV